MKLDFENMIVKNFRTFRGKHEFNFGDIGLNFMRGKNKIEPNLSANDAGKSSLWDAFFWCLFGTSVNGLRAPDLFPWGMPETTPMSVACEFSTDGAEHRLEREYNPNGLKLDGQTRGQEHIHKLLQMSGDLFGHTILMGQGQPLFFDLQPRDALALFGEGLNLSRWDARSQFSKEECDRLERKLAKLEGELVATKASRDDARDNMTKAKKQADDWAEGNRATIKALRAKLSEAEKELKKQQALRDEADLAHDGAGTELKAIQEEINEIRASYDNARDKKVKAEARIEGYKSNIDALQRELKSLGQSDRCPTCNQKITGTSLDKHKKEIKRKIVEWNELVVKGVPTSVRREMETFERSLKKSREDEARFKSKADDAFSTLKRLTGVVVTWESDVRNLKQRIADNEQAANVYHKQYIQFKKDLRSLNDAVEEIESDMSKARSLIERTRPWIKGFKEIRLLVVDRVLEELDFVTNSIVADLGLEDWKVQYAIDKETKSGSIQRGLNVTILSPRNKTPVKWKCWGGGVGQRLRIAGALAFSEVLLNHASVSCNLEALDEPTRHMSSSGARDLCDYLAQRAIKQKKSIWLIDHLSRESDKFSEIVTVVKDVDGSRIVWN